MRHAPSGQPGPPGTPRPSGQAGQARKPRDPFTAARDSAACLAKLTGAGRHDVAVVLGSGWVPAAAALGPARAEVPLAELGGFPAPTVAGHPGIVRSVTAGPVRALVFLGRTHLYEGHAVPVIVHGVRTAVAAGCRVVILTNAAGGLRREYQVGQPVLIRDHLNLTGRSPLAGTPPPPGYPPRFADMTGAYSPRLRALAREADPGLAEGVYAALPGPQYETPAEIGMLRSLGADLVGMSTVLEVIAARHLGAEVLAISVVTNPAAGLADHQLSHDEVVAAGAAAAARMGTLLAGILPRTC